jgi:hypothetical protein
MNAPQRRSKHPALLMACLLPMSGAWSADNIGPLDVEAACRGLISAGTAAMTIVAADVVPQGPLKSPAGATRTESLPTHCRIEGVLNARTAPSGERFGIGFELRLPASWNGRFAFQGGSGLDGVLHPAVGDVNGSIAPSALARGFAVVSTDGGHRGASMLDARFGLDQQARLDYAFNAIDKVTLEGKALVQRFYGRGAQRSYFLGCSNGGRQGMLAAQRFPAYFDGIVSGAPVFNLSRIVVNQVWNVQVVSRVAPKNADGQPILSRAFSDADLKLVADSALAACDSLDGLADGLINDWQACPFDPKSLACSGAKTERCLTTTQIEALHDLAGGARNSRGESLYGRFPYDTGIASPVWRRMRLGTSTSSTSDASDVVLGVQALRLYMLTPPDPAFDPLRFDFDRDLARTRQTQALGDADATYLRGFAAHGKMILYHGISDQGMAAGALADWYEKMTADTGAQTQDFARLFMVPGMTHCGGGKSTDRFDMLTAIQSWVEENRAPDRIVATGAAFPGVSRPLCPYPKVARYAGGDSRHEGSFECRK